MHNGTEKEIPGQGIRERPRGWVAALPLFLWRIYLGNFPIHTECLIFINQKFVLFLIYSQSGEKKREKSVIC